MKKRIVLALIFILFIVGLVIFIKIISRQKSTIPDVATVSQKTGFQVLIPKTPSNNLSFKGYNIEQSSANNQKILLLTFEGAKTEKILIYEASKSADSHLEDSVNLLFKQFSPQKTAVGHYLAFIIIKPSQESDLIQTKLLTWDDDLRHINIWFAPSTGFSDAEAINFAESLYN